MALPASTSSLQETLLTVKGASLVAKGTAQDAFTTLGAGNVDTVWVFLLLDKLRALISAANGWAAVAGINAYATAQLPGYAGTLTTDIQAVITAAQACIDWVVTNFPKDSTNTWLLGFSLNADGSRTARNFTPAQTAGLRTALQSLINAIG